ncbi:ATP-binding protein [Pseudomonas syringae]|uniref:ATP-binding protein n=1 Tax=Pseudomonas syringae TaxID=317 RepID=UPI000E311EA0|nr:ATP-binding protein [Pseudomonas syringae]MBS7437593.1 ATP-binding protein [Pseudomonas syringae]MCH5517394.1 ATP-binding protein [Pseudomonas syringae pv. lapsa]
MNDRLNEPDAPRLIYGLRDTGYNVKTATADIIDNSIAAKADVINIEIVLRSDGRKLVYFGDNGDGMDAKGIFDAMRYGAPERDNPESLGKFGLGLKTASSSVCLKYTLISRVSAGVKLSKLAWDLEHVASENKWEMLREEVTSDEQEVFEELCGDKGTLLIWEKCDRILTKEYDPGSTREKQAVNRLAETLTKHIALVFHRFIDKDDSRERNVKIAINKVPVEFWNPFYPIRSEQVLSPLKQRLIIEMPDGAEEEANIRAWILPHRHDMTKEEEKIHARISNRSQGFYVYREGRLIQDGSWLDVFGAPEPHTSLLRIEFDFGHELDDAFRIDVKKSRILFHPDLVDVLRELLQPVYREAGKRYRRQNREATKSIDVDHANANKNIADTDSVSKPKIEGVDSVDQSVVISNNMGDKIKIKSPVQNNVSAKTVHVEAVDNITTGELWQPAFRSAGEDGHVPAVLLNIHHDFYQKIYKRATSSGFAVEGMDYLLWAFAVAEQNNTNDEMEPIFEDIRNEISRNLHKLLRNYSEPEPSELTGEDEVDE